MSLSGGFGCDMVITMMKHLTTIQSRAALLFAAFLILSAASIRMRRAADASAPVDKSSNPGVVALNGADTAEMEFLVGASGKIAVMFKFADGILDYPLKLVGLYVQTHRQSLDLTQMKPVKGNIRLKDVSVIGVNLISPLRVDTSVCPCGKRRTDRGPDPRRRW